MAHISKLSDKNVWFMCKYCKICVNKREKLKEHMKLKHLVGLKLEAPTSIKEEPQERSTDSEGASPTEREETPQDIPDISWRRLRNRKIEFPKQSDIKPLISSNKHTRSKLRRRGQRLQLDDFLSENSHEFGKHKCSYCNATFQHTKQLEVHERIHTGEKPFKCRFCEKSFAQVTNCNNHERIHTGEKPFVCKICKKGFTQVTNLNFHERVHTGEKPYKCKICKQRFAQIANLHFHERSHTGEKRKPYKCRMCKEEFSQVLNYTFHLKTHIRGIGLANCKSKVGKKN